MKPVLIAIFGQDWKTTVIGLAEAAVVQALTYAINTEYNNPRIFWSGMGLSVLAAIRGRLTNEIKK